jgi:hypothetical protein
MSPKAEHRESVRGYEHLASFLEDPALGDDVQEATRRHERWTGLRHDLSMIPKAGEMTPGVRSAVHASGCSAW